MQNGHDHTPHQGGQQVQVDPRQAAQYALMFLQRVSHTRAEREAYDLSESLLQAIASGQVILAPPPAMPAQTAVAGETPPPQ
jgi:hypothetical protein